MNLSIEGYSKQTIYVFNKISKLFFENKKSHNASLIAGIRAILTTVEYDNEPEVDITMGIFQIRILFKRSRLFTTTHTDQ